MDTVNVGVTVTLIMFIPRLILFMRPCAKTLNQCIFLHTTEVVPKLAMVWVLMEYILYQKREGINDMF